MKIIIPERQVVESGAGLSPPDKSGVARAMRRTGQVVAQGVAGATAALEQRDRANDMATTTSRSSSAELDHDTWFLDRAQDGTKAETLLDDTKENQKLLRETALKGVGSGNARAMISDRLNKAFNRRLLHAEKTQIGQMRDLNLARLDQSLDNYRGLAKRAINTDDHRESVMAGVAAIEAQVESGTLSPSEGRKTRQKFAADMMFDQFENTLVNGGVELAEMQLKALKKNTPKDLDPDLKQTYFTRMQTLLNREIAAARATDKALEKLLRTRIKDASDALERGKIPPDIDQLAAAAKGTDLEEPMIRMVEDAAAVMEFAVTEPSVQEDILTKLGGKKRMSGRQAKILDKFNKTKDSQDRALKDDPMQLGVDLGLIDAPLQLDFMDNANLAEGVKDRSVKADVVNAHFERKLSPFMDQDIAQIKEILDQGDVNQQAFVLSALATGLGDNAPEGFNQIDKKVGAQFGYAGGLFVAKAPTAAITLLEGIAQRKTNKGMVPKDADLLTDSMVDDMMKALSGASVQRGKALEAVRSIYAGLAAKEGDFSGDIDSDRMEQAVNMATGGVLEWDPGFGVVGSTILAPRHGVTEDQFEDWINELTPKDLEKMGGIGGIDEKFALDKMKSDGQLVTAGQGRYLVKIGNGFIMNKNGEPFILEWNQ